MSRAATIRTISRFPVKSMAGEALTSVPLTLQGLAEDRRYAFVQRESRSVFPWLTGREYPDLLRYQPRFDGADRPRLLVTTPDGDTLPVDSDALRERIEARCGCRLWLLRDHRGNYDIAYVSLISSATIARIAAESGTPPEPRRFRMNLVVETNDGTPSAEDAWVGRILRLGDTARIAITARDKRCVMTTLDPDGGPQRPEVLRAIAQGHESYAGVYGVVLTPGTVGEGDAIHVEA